MNDHSKQPKKTRSSTEKLTHLWALLVIAVFFASGCAHYPVNQPLKQIDPQGGYRGKYMGAPGNSENLLVKNRMSCVEYRGKRQKPLFFPSTLNVRHFYF
jgi:hypothetical protein